MPRRSTSERGVSQTGILLFLVAIFVAVLLGAYGRIVRRFVRESVMQSVTSSHYVISCISGAMSPQTMGQFAMEREATFSALDRKLGDADSNAEIHIIFDTDPPLPVETASTPQPYTISGSTIRTKLDGLTPQLDSAADAEALLQIAWGKRGNARIGQWVAVWLVGERDGKDLGIAAAEIEQRIGHQKVDALLDPSANRKFSPSDLPVLGAAWISAIEELGGIREVRKLYSTKMTNTSMQNVTAALGTSPVELERKWQLWMYAYLAGMPPMDRDSAMPEMMRMSGGH